MVNIGIDFGSTYTTISVYRADTAMVESLSMSSSPYIPTLVAKNNGHWEVGLSARAITGKPGVPLYKGFKMLLPETDETLLAQRGYTGLDTPRTVAGLFLEHCLRWAMASLRTTRIDHLVVGVPEIWNERAGGSDGRAVLKKIFGEMDFVKDLQVISEPAAASAFFAHNFKLQTGKEYEGSILLIDYGGGTLDLTLTEVSSRNGAAQIRVMERTGAGENADGQIGKAGIVYMETVVAEAIARSGLWPGQTPPLDGRFYKAVNSLEQELQFCTETIKAVFDEYGIDDLEELNREFTSLDYRGEYIPVTYALLVEVYNQLIRPVLEEQLRFMMDYMDRNNIPYMDRDQQVFKIALVGGFGNFYLVSKQIEDKFRFSTMDQRQKNIIRIRSDREKSISMGAAMLAAGAIRIRHSAPYCLGMFGRDPQGKARADFAIQFKQELEFGKVYFCPDNIQSQQAGRLKKARYLLSQRQIPQLVWSKDSRPENILVAPVRQEYLAKLQALTEPDIPVAVGFSLDERETVSLHIHPYPLDREEPLEQGISLELAQCGRLLVLEEGKRVIDL